MAFRFGTRRKHWGLPLLTASLALLLTPPAGAQTPWTLVWSDEFNGPGGSAPNPAVWTYDIGTDWGVGNIDFSTDSRQNSFLDGQGNLVIALLFHPGGNPQYTSARLKTAGLLAVGPYGRLEARIKVPFSRGLGAAFWALGNNFLSGVGWPDCGEIDIMEHIGRLPTENFGTIHGPTYPFVGVGTPFTLPGGAQFRDDFHVFGILWSPYRLQWYVDGTVYGDLNLANLPYTGTWPFNQSIFLINSMGLGGVFAGPPDATTVFPQHMTTDYIRYYRLGAGAPAAPGLLSAGAAASNAINLTWTASSTAGVAYNIYGSTSPGFSRSFSTLVAQNVTGTSFTHGALRPGTTYHYQVVATNTGGESGPGNPASATTQAPGNGAAVAINAGGYAAGRFVNDTYSIGGNTNAHNVPIDRSGVANPAPQQVYQTERWGASAWTITDLTPGSPYRLRLHFAETTFTQVGQRRFNVGVNGATALADFDILAAAGAPNRAVVREVTAIADENGIVQLELLPGSSDQPTISGIEVVPTSSGAGAVGSSGGSLSYFAVDVGGAGVGGFLSDRHFYGGFTNSTPNPISTAGVSNPAPAQVYQTERWAPSTYVIPQLVPRTAYNLRLHFAEPVFMAAGQRRFHAAVNGRRVLQDYDIFLEAGGMNRAVVREIPAVANRYGMIVLQLTQGSADQPSVRGIELVRTGGIPPAETNLALGKPATASSVENAGTTPGLAVDGNATATRWSSAFSDPQWIAVDLGGTASLSRVALRWEAAYGRAYQIQVSNDGSAWTTLVQVTAGDGSVDDHPVSGSGRFVRMLGTARGTGWGYSLWEFEVYGTMAAPSAVALNAGGPAVGRFAADAHFTGGGTAATGNAIDLGGVAAPLAVYQTERAGVFTYTVPGFAPGSSHTVRLHFAEFYWTTAGRRVFDVRINGAPALTGFDIVATAGAPNRAVVRSFTASADAGGRIVVEFRAGGADQPKLSGLEIQ